MVEQGLFHSQTQSLRQEQIIAPHQIQSLEILQMPLQDLYARIQEELAGNPVMEMGPESANQDGNNDQDGNDHGDGNDDGGSNSDGNEPTVNEFGEQLVGDPVEDVSGTGGSNTDDDASRAAEKDEFLANLMQVEESWRDYLPPSHATGRSSDSDEKRQYMFDSLAAETTLEEELLAQLRTADCDDETFRIGEQIVGSIDPTGHLESSIEELAHSCGASEDKVQATLRLIQTFDPPGVGCRDLRECLLLQLERADRKDSLAWRVVDRHLGQIARNRLPAIARSLRVSVQAIADAVEEIRRLQPRPGSAVGGGGAHFVQPEVFVTFNENKELEASANERSLPRVRISRMYRELLESPNTPADTKRYIREKVLGVKTLQRSLMQRESTIKLIADCILKHQRDYFYQGDEGMVPLTMTQVAEEIGVHETTVSRAIAHKYMETPRGLVPLRHFFSSGYVTDDGEQLSSHAVRSKLQALIDGEDSKKPLSDAKLVELLRADGFDVARRTVAKYRDELKIPSSHLRRQHGA